MKPHANDIKMFSELLSVLEKYDSYLKQDYEIDIRSKLLGRINACEIASNFNVELDFRRVNNHSTFIRFDEYRSIALYGKKHSRTISWSDDGSQPEEEWLFVISFPTGPYIFGDEYPEKTFESFFNELKSYSPKYIDTVNKSLYFDKQTAKMVHENFSDLLRKYREISKKEAAATKIQKLQDQLDKLKAV